MKSVKVINDIPVTLYQFEFCENTLPELEPHLSKTELKNAQKFKDIVLQQHYIFARGKLRESLSEHLNIAPHEIEFQFGCHGKPYLSDTTNQQNIQFNLSHASGHVLIGITQNHPIGVDVEPISNRANRDIAKRFFATEEIEHLSDKAGQHFNEAFFYIWTRKESFVKCTGNGLSTGLDTFSVLEDIVLKNHILYTHSKKGLMSSFACNLIDFSYLITYKHKNKL